MFKYLTKRYPLNAIRYRKGMTLVEMVIYITIISVFLVALTNFTLDVISAQTKSESVQETQQNLRLAMTRMSQEMRAAKDINIDECDFGHNPGKISLVMEAASGKNPTIFDVDNNRLRIKQGSGAYQYLTSDKVKITNLVFTNLSAPDSPKNIKINMTIERVNTEERQDMDALISAETAISFRQKP